MSTITSVAIESVPLGLRQDGLCKLVHDLRTPLKGVIGLTRLLASGTCTSVPAETILEMMQTSAQHMLALVNDIVDLASAKSGALALVPERTAVEEVFAGVRSLIGMQAAAKGLQLQLLADADVPPLVTVDRRRLVQVLTNLAANAIDFTHSGTVSVQVRRAGTQPAGADATRLNFEVRDSGIGMSNEEAARVFEPFTQGIAGARRGGNGLGLAICQELVNRMGGRITVQSQPGAGSCFAFELDLQRSVNPQAGRCQPAPAATKESGEAAFPCEKAAAPAVQAGPASDHEAHEPGIKAPTVVPALTAPLCSAAPGRRHRLRRDLQRRWARRLSMDEVHAAQRGAGRHAAPRLRRGGP